MAIYRVQRLFSITQRLFGLSQEIKMVTENIRRLKLNPSGNKQLLAQQEANLSKMQETLRRQQQAGAEIAKAKAGQRAAQSRINGLEYSMKGTRGKTRQGIQQQINTLQTNSQGAVDQAMENLQGIRGSAPVNNVTVNYTGQTTRGSFNPFSKKPKLATNNIGNDKLVPGRYNKPKAGTGTTTSTPPKNGTGTTPTGGGTPPTGSTPTGGGTSGGGVAESANNSWWSQQSGTTKGLIIGGGTLAAGGLGYAALSPGKKRD